MSTKRVLLVVLVASMAMLVAGAGPRIAGTVRALPPAQGAAAPGATIPYPGRLEDDTGQPVDDGVYDFRFALYAAAQGGEPLWTEVQRGVAVQDGAFLASLGSASLIPDRVLAGDAGSGTDRPTRWLAVAVRGPDETEFTALTPRQQLEAAAPTAPSNPTAGPACPHDHYGEVWSGTGSDGLTVSTGDGIALWGWSDSYIGVAGVSTPFGFTMPSNREYGVYGYSNSDHGVYGFTNGNWSYHSGVYGEAIQGNANGVTGWNTGNGVGVYGHSGTGWAGYYDGPVYIKGRGNTVTTQGLRVENSDSLIGLWARDDGTVAIGTLGGLGSHHVCTRFEDENVRNVLSGCASASEYVPTADLGLGFPETGDLVSMVPAAGNQHGDGHAPFVVVQASSPYDPNLIGFITDPSMGADGLMLNDDYLPLAIYGYFPVNVTMHNGPIRRGDPITSSPEPGLGMKATGPGRIVGYALEDAEQDGVIQVFAQAGDYLGDAPERIDRLEAEVLTLKQAQERTLEQNADLVARISALEALVAGSAGKEGGQ